MVVCHCRKSGINRNCCDPIIFSKQRSEISSRFQHFKYNVAYLDVMANHKMWYSLLDLRKNEIPKKSDLAYV